jgi:hypothetical protein
MCRSGLAWQMVWRRVAAGACTLWRTCWCILAGYFAIAHPAKEMKKLACLQIFMICRF